MAIKRIFTKSAKAAALPTQELDLWLKDRTYWNHQDWLELLEALEEKGFGAFTQTQESRDQIGLYLEEHRAR